MTNCAGSDESLLLSKKPNRQYRKDCNEPPTLIKTEGLMDRYLPNCIFEFFHAGVSNMGSFFAPFVCFAVELHDSG